MKRLFLISSFAITTLAFTLTISAQTTSSSDSLMMTGRFSDKEATGIFVKGNDENINQDWSVFLGNDGKVYNLSSFEQNIAELYVDGEKISSENISQYSANTKPYLDKLAMQKEIEKLQNEIDAKQEYIDKDQAEIDKVTEKIDEATAKIDELRDKHSIDLSAERDNLSKLRDKNSKFRDSISAKRDVISAQRDKLSAQRDKIDNVGEINKVLDKIISDLKAEGIIKNSNNLSFKLSNREFIVNGKRQPAEIYNKLKAKYVIETNSEAGFLYRWKEKV
jgi:vacuolar-type H+-ATPase subunit I/STV1